MRLNGDVEETNVYTITELKAISSERSLKSLKNRSLARSQGPLYIVWRRDTLKKIFLNNVQDNLRYFQK